MIINSEQLRMRRRRGEEPGTRFRRCSYKPVVTTSFPLSPTVGSAERFYVRPHTSVLVLSTQQSRPPSADPTTVSGLPPPHSSPLPSLSYFADGLSILLLSRPPEFCIMHLRAFVFSEYDRFP